MTFSSSKFDPATGVSFLLFQLSPFFEFERDGGTNSTQTHANTSAHQNQQLQCVTVCCSVLQSVARRCSVL